MWKFVRNMLLLTVALAAALQLLLWVAAQQQAGAIASQLVPWLDLRYSGAGAGFDGTLRLKDVQVTFKRGAWRDAFVADRVSLRAGGPLWLLARAVSRGDDFPDDLQLEAGNLHAAPSLAKSLAAWFGAKSGVPFDDFGCGHAFGDADYAAMQRAPQAASLSLHVERDAAAKSLQLDARLADQPFATLHLRAELKPFDFAMLDDAKAQAGARLASASLGWRDDGYLAARNRYCAQRLGASVDGYLDRHLAAVTEFLAAREIEPSADAVGLYRALLAKGGEAELLSLPNPAVAPASYGTYDRAEVLRFLNLTAHHDQSPPVLFKLAFIAPPPREPEGDGLVAPPAATSTAPVATAVPAPTTSPSAGTTSATKPVVATSAPAVTPAPPVKPEAITPVPATTSPKPVAAPVATVSRDAVLDKPGANPVLPAAAPPKPVAPVATPATTAATTAPPPAKPAGTVEALRDPVTGKPVETGAPPEDVSSTAAMVWKSGVVERLPEAGPRELPYIVTALESLENRAGEYVILVTEGGKQLEGVLVGVTRDSATLRVRRETGSADLDVPRARIREVRLPRARE